MSRFGSRVGANNSKHPISGGGSDTVENTLLEDSMETVELNQRLEDPLLATIDDDNP